MKRSTLALVALLMVGIAWLVWRPSAPDASPPAPPASETSATAPELQQRPATPAPASSTAAVNPESLTRNDPSPATAAAAADATEILLRGRVLNEKDEPVTGASLRWLDDNGSERSAAIANGDYALPGMRAGRYIVALVGAGLRRDSIDVELAARPAIQERDFRAHGNPQVLIRLLDASGDRRLDLSDAVFVFNFLFTGGRSPLTCPEGFCNGCIAVSACGSSCGG